MMSNLGLGTETVSLVFTSRGSNPLLGYKPYGVLQAISGSLIGGGSNLYLGHCSSRPQTFTSRQLRVLEEIKNQTFTSRLSCFFFRSFRTGTFEFNSTTSCSRSPTPRARPSTAPRRPGSPKTARTFTQLCCA